MLTILRHREKLREQNALSEEIVSAITTNALGETVDDADLEEELEAMQQEQLDESLLKTGTVPVSDQIQRMPAAANGESKFDPHPSDRVRHGLTPPPVKGKAVEEDDEEAELRKLQAEMAM